MHHQITEYVVDLPAINVLSDLAPELLIKATERGPVRVRGLAVDSPEALRAALDALDLHTRSYVQGNSPRTELAANIFTATDFPSAYPISLHNELSYTTCWPEYLLFACRRPAPVGGGTLVAGGAEIARRVPEEMLARLREMGVCYTQFLHDGSGVGLSWQTTFGSDRRADAERVLAREPHTTFRWIEDAGVRIERWGPGVLRHPKTGVEVWFNQAEQWDISGQPEQVAQAIGELLPPDQWPHRAFWGDSTPFAPGEMAEIRQAYEDSTQRIDWEPGDLVIIDNATTMHGREPFEGEREVMVALAGNTESTDSEY